jgi:hypothetical protein
MTNVRFARVLRPWLPAAAVALAVILPAHSASTLARSQQSSAAGLPSRLSDADFWQLVTDISEPGGFFRITDNYTSNEFDVGSLVTWIKEKKISGGVYLGVGPEQNFSYIAAVQPAMAFIVDIRRQAVMQHLMFKAIFELSKDRVDFISLLFAKPRPKELAASAPIQTIWETFFNVPIDDKLAATTRERIVSHLTRTKKFALTEEELSQLNSVITAFVQFGPGISTRGALQGRGGGGGSSVTFADLTGWSLDATGLPQSFLSSEEHFRTVKTLHDRNLIVPASGDFGGAKTLKAIAAYLKERNARLTAFYVSNVEQYLFMDAKQYIFYENVTAFPVSETSVFIRPYAVRRIAPASALCAIGPFLKAVQDGRVMSNTDATSCAGY